jgi:hypothetical protein
MKAQTSREQSGQDLDVATVLFLDFDGVTHPEPTSPANFFAKLPLIESVLREFPIVQIVISSSWRMDHSLTEMVAYFSQDIGALIVGQTDSIKKPGSNWLPGFVPTYEREWECEQWMKLNRPWGTPWIAIDDRDHWFSPGCKHLVATDVKIGFTDQDAIRLRELLKERST